ncbi:WD repeat-containing protein 93 isoform X2 [Salmo trutta]|uniref:WD repeat domain 93 n=2 Tax=Salmo trutta TaxID=8032 RepID=A0A674DZF6_SALTR|nr:WD repeat-containing protein 93 isoform X2 [Salmo trutta]XP_029600859.1 WD repeat-containing protein 93 isoform X2 [Salmo trutta]
MPVYIRKGPADIPEPPDSSQGDEEQELFLSDPDQLQDQLPQPFRMIDKVLDRLVDRAWDFISQRETARVTEQANKAIPIMQVSGDVKLPVRTNCLACSEDGRYIFLGHPHGLSVMVQPQGITTSSSSPYCVPVWQEDQVEITSLHITCLGEMAYLLASLDDMGVARLFAYYSETSHLIKVMNETDDLNQRSVCVKFELSRGGDYGAATISYNGCQCLEVYRFPKDSWLKELYQHAPGVGDTGKLSPVTMLMKIRPPKPHTGSTMKSPFEVLQKTEDGNVIGSGQNHLISSRQWEDQDAVFKSVYRKYMVTNPSNTTDPENRPSCVTSHFLLPGGLSSVLGGVKPQTGGVAVAVCLWWSGSHNLLQYLLWKAPKDKADPEPKADALWPNAQEILCSAVSSCTRHITLGLVNGLVTVWDRHLGLPLSVVSVEADSVFSSIIFVDYWPSTATEDALHSQGPNHTSTQVHLLVTCKSGACHLVYAGRGLDSHDVTQLSERPSDPGCFPVVTATVPFLQRLALIMQRNGKIFLQDMVDRRVVCCFSLPDTHLLASPWNPVFLLDPTQQSLLITGDQRPGRDSGEELEDGGSRLFVFRFQDAAVVKPYRHGHDGRASSHQGQSGTGAWNLEETCNLYFQPRIESVEERNKVMTETWNQLQEHAALVLLQNQQHPVTILQNQQHPVTILQN